MFEQLQKFIFVDYGFSHSYILIRLGIREVYVNFLPLT
jgi:hypothetical protein